MRGMLLTHSIIGIHVVLDLLFCFYISGQPNTNLDVGSRAGSAISSFDINRLISLFVQSIAAGGLYLEWRLAIVIKRSRLAMH